MIRPQPHLGGKTNDFDIDLLSRIQMEHAASKTGILLSWRHILMDHQQNAVVGIDNHSVVIAAWPSVEVHLSVYIVTTILRYVQSSLGIFKAVQHMAFGIITIPCSDYYKRKNEKETNNTDLLNVKRGGYVIFPTGTTLIQIWLRSDCPF